MIKKFSVIYVGHLELENVGRGGTAADARRYPNERFQEAYWTARDAAQLMDELGYWCLWTAEHHFQREGYEVFPNLVLLNTWLATQTKRLKHGCAFNTLTTWHPIRLAEDYAVADIVTGGRVILGVGRGYQTREVETLGAPLIDADANRELFEVSVDLLVKALHDDVLQHDGKHFQIPARVPYRGYDLEDITVVPRPLRQPVEMWQAISSGRTISFIAKRGIKGITSLTGELMVEQIAHQYRDAAAEVGRDLALGEDISRGFGLYIADTEHEAIERLRPFHDERYKWFAPFGIVRYTDEKGQPIGTPGGDGLPAIEDGVSQQAWLCGPPETIVARLKEWEERYPGLEHVMIHWAEGMPWSVFEEQLRVFAAEVMPRFPSS